MDSPITKKSRGSRPPFGMLVIIIIQQKKLKIKLHLDYKDGFLLTKLYFSLIKVAFRLQNITSHLQKLRFELQSGISPYYSLMIYFLIENTNSKI